MTLRLAVDDPRSRLALASTSEELARLGFDARYDTAAGEAVVATPLPGARRLLDAASERSLLEQALGCIPLDFDALPVVVEGESKIVRAWTPSVVVERFKPTLYSFTTNRSGTVADTDTLRARISANIFRRMARDAPAFAHRPSSAFLALVETVDGPLTVQRKVDSCNLEVRIKRYHVGSPVHRYRYTERHATAHHGAPVRRWTRFRDPVVCFDWRNPLVDEQGVRLADEPLSDDYAAVWMDDAPFAKEMAREVFAWLERLFRAAGLILVDMCLFVDRSGRVIYGEISPDCMRVRFGSGDPEHAPALDKDLWRAGVAGEKVRDQYHRVYEMLDSEGGRDGSHRSQEPALEDVAGRRR